MFYHFDIDRWIVQFLPPVLRKKSIYSFLRCLLYPLKQLHAAFLTYKLGVDRQLAYNAFQNYLERFLNGLFFFESNVIYLTDEQEASAYLAFASEAYGPVYMSYQTEFPSTAIDMSSIEPSLITGYFVVHVPAALSPSDIATITAWVNYYKMAGIDFKVETYE